MILLIMKRLTAENPPKNTEIIPGAVGGKVPEIKPVKQLSFVPTKVVKVFYKAEYSEIQEALRDIDTSNRQVLDQR